MANKIEIDITANDQASKVIANLQNNLRAFSNGFQNSFLGNLGATAVVGAIEKVTQGFRSFTTAINDASKIETQSITGANAIALNMGISLDKALDLQRGVSTDIAKMAAELPGSTAEYNQVALNIGGLLGKVFRDDIPGWRKALSEVTRGVGAIAATSGISVSGAGQDAAAFLGGTRNFSELRQLEFFERNPELQNQLRLESAKLGLDLNNLRNWTAQQRINVLRAATGNIITPSFLAKITGSTEAQLESFRSALFDPQVGLFGFIRKLDGLGDRSILDTFAGFLRSTAKLTASAQAIATKLGFSIDPLEPLGNLIDWLADFNLKVSGYLDSLSIGNLKNFNLGTILNGAINTFSLAVENFNGVETGKAIANIVNGIVGSFADFITTADWGELGRGMVKFSLEMWLGVLSYFANFDYGQMLQAMFGVLQSVLRYLQGGILSSFQSFTQMLSGGLSYTVAQIKAVWDGLVDSLKRIFSSITTSISNIIPEPIRNAGGAIGGAGETLGNIWNEANRRFDALVEPLNGTPENSLNKPINTPKSTPNNAQAFSPSISVYPSPGMDETAIANLTMEKLSSAYSRYTQSLLT